MKYELLRRRVAGDGDDASGGTWSVIPHVFPVHLGKSSIGDEMRMTAFGDVTRISSEHDLGHWSKADSVQARRRKG